VSKLLLDTNAYIALLKGDEDVLNASAEAERLFMTVVVLAELYTGFKGGNKERTNRKVLKTFINKPTVRILNVTRDTSEIFADIKNTLRKAGQPIPINDIWIAASTQETGSWLVTFDKHFSYVPGLRLWQK